ncbi:MAG: heavy-metal-associated domain-containing protein [Bacteroidales bacterium]|nr:heavy-metal-associated domain-containing protein [Bacteroidales bacterium]
MKTTISIFLFIITFNVFGQKEVITTEFKVEGVCDECKKRIENAATIKGVKFVSWDKETETIKIIYRTDKVKLQDIHKAIANAGHDTGILKASEEAYNKLPKCCEYRGGIHKH